MLASDIPVKLVEAFAKSAGGAFIRTIPKTSADPFAASLDLGFPPDTFIDPGAGGEPPDGRDVNGILNMVSAWVWWQAAGGPIKYDGTFQTAVGGYAKGAVVGSTVLVGLYWISLVDSNTTNPDTAGAGWVPFSRVRLSANTNFYINNSTGNDLNDGLSPGTAWLTPQHAWNTLQALYDLNGFSATFNFADGNYTTGFSAGGTLVGQGNGAVGVQLRGNTVTPGNVTFTAGSGISAIICRDNAAISIQGFKITSTGTGAAGIEALSGGRVTINGPMEYGACAGAQIASHDQGSINITNSYLVSGGGDAHYLAYSGGQLAGSGLTVTVSGGPTFVTAFAECNIVGAILMLGNTYSGGVTGSRFTVTQNGVITTGGGGANYFPGSSPGTQSTGGQYT